ncbi:sensor histidine kinase [Pedobacter sp. KR3-3]|uniref:Sensor histidine kinase n=1 Tax=Pedobacter albus TaxID=3113905 RepID=A0ABU7IAC2_9SPHI|nr:sensor histidine kinase [Pedobacter sp. KR3-3]MEE1946425.1 sensor histidine kinase [Pedobacter sp. KR3-3]
MMSYTDREIFYVKRSIVYAKTRATKISTKQMEQRTKRKLYHLPGVLLVIGYEQGFVFSYTHEFHFISTMIYYLIDIPVFFLISYKAAPYLHAGHRRLLRTVCLLTVMFICYLLLQNIADYFVLWYRSGQTVGWTFSGKKSFWRFVYLTGFATAYFLSREGLRRAREGRDLEVRNLELETAYLRSVIKPHFIFNTLNFIHSEVAELSATAATSVSLLAEVMQYAVQPSGKAVSLEEELAQVNHYVMLNRIRLGEQLQLQMDLRATPECRQYNVPPLILTNLVENMFKHGNLYDRIHPGRIRITCEKRTLSLFTWNLKARARPLESASVGMAYLQNLLDRNYPGKHCLQVKTEENTFELLMTLQL